MRVKLKSLVGKSAGKVFRIPTERFLIGRSEKCQLRPRSESVSRYHCVIAERNDKLLLQDLKSRNGTYVNGKRLPTDSVVALHNGDELKVGNLHFEVMIKPPKSTTAQSAAPASGSTGQQSKSGTKGVDEKPSQSGIDISEWLDDDDTGSLDRAARDAETRRLELPKVEEHEEEKADAEEEHSHAALIEQLKAKKKNPGKLPMDLKLKAEMGDSRDAAGQALKQFFRGG